MSSSPKSDCPELDVQHTAALQENIRLLDANRRADLTLSRQKSQIYEVWLLCKELLKEADKKSGPGVEPGIHHYYEAVGKVAGWVKRQIDRRYRSLLNLLRGDD